MDKFCFIFIENYHHVDEYEETFQYKLLSRHDSNILGMQMTEHLCDFNNFTIKGNKILKTKLIQFLEEYFHFKCFKEIQYVRNHSGLDFGEGALHFGYNTDSKSINDTKKFFSNNSNKFKYEV